MPTSPHFEAADLDWLGQSDDVKLEWTGGVPTWEARPSPRHQRAVRDISRSIASCADQLGNCSCFYLNDTYIRFPDGSLKRPDIAIFCSDPPDQDEALTIVPEAVIEIISEGYEYKDLVLNPPFYLGQGIQDIVLFDPRTRVVTHVCRGHNEVYMAPVTLTLQCGCQVTM